MAENRKASAERLEAKTIIIILMHAAQIIPSTHFTNSGIIKATTTTAQQNSFGQRKNQEEGELTRRQAYSMRGNIEVLDFLLPLILSAP